MTRLPRPTSLLCSSPFFHLSPFPYSPSPLPFPRRLQLGIRRRWRRGRHQSDRDAQAGYPVVPAVDRLQSLVRRLQRRHASQRIAVHRGVWGHQRGRRLPLLVAVRPSDRPLPCKPCMFNILCCDPRHLAHLNPPAIQRVLAWIALAHNHLSHVMAASPCHHFTRSLALSCSLSPSTSSRVPSHPSRGSLW